MKLSPVLRGLSPELGKQLDALGTTMLSAASAMSASDGRDEELRRQMRSALVRYAMLLADSKGESIDEDDLSAKGLLSNAQCELGRTEIGRRTAFSAIGQHLKDTLDLSVDPDFALKARRRAVAGLEQSDGESRSSASESTEQPAASKDVVEYFLDSEFVAIYW